MSVVLILVPPATYEAIEKFEYSLEEYAVGKPHAPHATREEAEECLQQWRLSRPIEFSEKVWDNWSGCQAWLGAEDTKELLEAIKNCPTPFYHETHLYCPSCPWTEEVQKEPDQRCDNPTKSGARIQDVGFGQSIYSLCSEHMNEEVVHELIASCRITFVVYS